VPPAVLIHPTAIVAAGAQLGEGVQIGPFSQIGPEVVLGDHVRVVSHAAIDGRTSIGAGAVIFPFCSVGLAPQDLKYKGEPTRTEIGPRTQLREHCTIHRGTITGTGITRVGADCLLMAVVHVAHDCEVGDGVVIANNVVMGGHVTIGDNAVIGGSSALHQFVRIGRGAMVGGVSGVEADVIPFGSVLGNRARLAGLNLIGLKRRGYDHVARHRLRTAFRRLFTGSGVFASRLAAVRQEFAHDELVAELLRFIDAPSKRGLIRAAVDSEEERGADAA
jgi:UDP-N-acetylglucosamine acyltransferase